MGDSLDDFNLFADHWLPAFDAAGTRRFHSLESLFQQAGGLADLDLRPHERVAVMRLLVCVTQAALGAPEEESGWEDFALGFEEKIAAYLHAHRAAFELFGDGPRFLQARPDKTGEPVPVSKLLPHLATGNNPTPFDHGGGTHRPLPPAALALALLTFQNFYPLYGAGYKGRGPCVDANMLHTLVRGDTLRETILRNCLDRRTLEHPQLGGLGRPIWEQVPQSPDDRPAVDNATRTYLGRLVPRHRTVWLADDRANFFLSQRGWEYPTFELFREPTATVIPDPVKKTDRLLSASLHRAVWRELHAITVRRKSEGPGGPLVLKALPSSRGESDAEVCIWTGALVTDFKAKVLDVVESVFHVPARMFDFTGQKLYQEGVDYAQSRARHLFNAVKAYGETFKNDNGPVNRATRHYWNALDQQSARLLETVRDTSVTEPCFGGVSTDPWTRAVRAALHDAYDAVCPRFTPRQIEAYAAGLRALSPAPAKPKTARAGKTRAATAAV